MGLTYSIENELIGQPPNDLLDQRDLLVRQLSEQVSVTTVTQGDGSMNVFTGSGQALVAGNDVRHLAVQGSEFDPMRLEVVYQGVSGNLVLDNNLTGGAIGGLLDFRSQMLDPTRQALGETALALTLKFNEQHGSGMDLRGVLGEDFFGIDAPTVLSSGRNSGTGTASAAISDISMLTGADYILEYDGATYTLSRADTGQAVAMAGSGSPADPFVADGLSLIVGGAPAAGDRLMIRPARDVAGSISTLIDDPRAVAMALPVRLLSSDANIGSASIGSVSIVDRNDPGLLTSSLIEFTSPTSYTINGAGSFTYTSGGPISINGASFVINGNPAAGDQFTLEANFGASGDNSNGMLLAQVQSAGILAGGTQSINDNYAQLIASVGSTTHQVQSNLDAQSVILASTEDAYLSNSGVNLDEEAANLIRFQMAYQAVAQVISVASTLFDTLLNATRR